MEYFTRALSSPKATRNARILTAIVLLGVALSTQAQPDMSPSPDAQEGVEEIVVTGERYRYQLRLQMMDAERAAYDLFNELNDETRFDIFCNRQLATGSRIDSARQHCQPNFEIQANRNHARDYLESYRLFLDPNETNKTSAIHSQPLAATIAAQQRAYQRKMKQIAEEHPEFLEAIIKYSEIKAQYEATVE